MVVQVFQAFYLFFVNACCIFSIIFIPFWFSLSAEGDQITQQYSNLLLIYELNSLIIGSLSHILKVLIKSAIITRHSVVTLPICSLNIKSFVANTPKTLTVSFISISSPDYVLYNSIVTSSSGP